MKENTKQKGNMEASYLARQIMKQELIRPWSQKQSKPIAYKGLNDLWEIRFHPCYQSFPNSEPELLTNILKINIERIELDNFFGFPREFRKSYKNLVPFHIPDLDEPYQKGLLTDKIIESKQTLLEQRALLNLTDKPLSEDERHYISENQGIMSYQKGTMFPVAPLKEGMRVRREDSEIMLPVEEVEQMFADKHAYVMFIVGITFPYLEPGTEAERLVKENWLDYYRSKD
ncbi:hypothetical protein HYW74_03820 [Candidatus Pacearchaeota archaeon]|nr:hypothetical protein [Candidatus Pacearchaeota archaeon]